jgi:hypothetical protein
MSRGYLSLPNLIKGNQSKWYKMAGEFDFIS